MTAENRRRSRGSPDLRMYDHKSDRRALGLAVKAESDPAFSLLAGVRQFPRQRRPVYPRRSRLQRF